MVMTSSLQEGCVILVTLYFYLTEKAVLYIDEVLAATTMDEIFETNSSFHVGTSFTWPKAIFSKILVLDKKADRNIRGNWLKNHFRHLKLYSHPPSWLSRNGCHMRTFWKTKDLSLPFWESQPFRFWYVEVPRQRTFKSTKTSISS